MGLARFMASTAGRLLRVVAGVVLIWVGLASVGGTGGWILAVVGLVFVAVGVFNICLLAPLFGGPLRGRDLQQAA